MIIKRLDGIKDLEEFVMQNKKEKILLRSTGINNYLIMKRVIDTCKNVDEFLLIEIGSDYFYIKKLNYKVNDCTYFISDRSLETVIKLES